MEKKTALYEEHIKLNAKMVPFAGWSMPVQYTSVKDEVLSVRNNVGVFDVSHMGEFIVEGEDAVKFVDYIVTNDFKNAALKKAVYSPLCRENGTVVDDLIAYKIAEQKILICVNASNMEKDWAHINQYASKFNCKLKNESDNYSLLAIQGPKTEELLRKIEILSKNLNPEYYSAQEIQVHGENIIIARTGYTGEDGFEIFGSHLFIKNLWTQLIKNGAIPCGLAARDVLRLEVAYPLYGHEIKDDITPLDCALKWTVKMDKENFVGKKALQNYNPKYQLVKLILESGVPRADYPVENTNGDVIGTIASGTMSVILNKGIATALIKKELMPSDLKFIVNIRNKKYEAIQTKQAFVVGGHK